VTCHQEHRPGITSTMGLSLPGDYCYRCHQDIGEDRPTHVGLAFDSCASGGCHNFHDNQALYEDFLVRHRDEPDMLAPAVVPPRALLPWAIEKGFAMPTALTASDADAPDDLADRARWVEEWASTSHAQAGVNCLGCHAADPADEDANVEASGAAGWQDRPSIDACKRCHALENEGFLAGRHGMRIAAGLDPMTPAQARLPMHASVAGESLGCDTCHPAHDYDTRAAAMETCLECHADEHSLAFEGTPHARLWEAELAGTAPAGSGVSCATCHLPRISVEAGPARVLVAHGQNDFLRPNEKMIRSSCLACHGLGFAMDALADPALVENNFAGRPAREVESIHFAAVLRWEKEGRQPPWLAEADATTTAIPTTQRDEEKQR